MSHEPGSLAVAVQDGIELFTESKMGRSNASGTANIGDVTLVIAVDLENDTVLVLTNGILGWLPGNWMLVYGVDP